MKNGTRKFILGSISASNEVQVVLNDVIIPLERVELIQPDEIFSAEVITGFFAQGLYGFPIVVRLLGRDLSEYTGQPKGVLNINHPGYHIAREFYKPIEEAESTSASDLRTTLYWNPNVVFTNKALSLKSPQAN